MEVDTKIEKQLDDDLNAIIIEFVHFRECHNKEHKALQELKGIVRTQTETIRLARDAERNERQKANQARLIIAQQQSIVGNLQQVMEENAKLLEQNKTLAANNEELLTKMKREIANLETANETLKTNTAKEMEEIKMLTDQRVREAQQEMESYRNEYNMKQTEMEETFSALQAQKYEELNLTTLVYEEKLQKMEENMTISMSESSLKLEESAAMIAALKQRNIDLENKLADAEKYRQLHTLQQTATAYRYQQNSLRANSFTKKTPAFEAKMKAITSNNAGNEYQKPAWCNQQSSSNDAPNTSSRRTIQPLPFQAPPPEEPSSAKKVTFAAAEPKKRRLFTLQDDI